MFHLKSAACARIIALSAIAFCGDTLGEEGGAGHYVPGALSTFIDLPPTRPGWVVETAYVHYNGDVSFAVAGGLLAADLRATSGAYLVGGFYTFEEKVMGSWFSSGVFLPYVSVDVKATVGSPLGSLRRHDTADGLGDISLLPAMMAWKDGDWQINALLPIYVPTGDYDQGRLANPGLNYWTFDPSFGLAYSGSTNGLNAALHTGFTVNTKNNATNYKSGRVWHVEASLSQALPLGSGFVLLGANAFYFDQISRDSGSGATLGDFKGETMGVGPTLAYILPLGTETLAFEFKWLPETNTEKRLNGDFYWAKVIYQFE